MNPRLAALTLALIVPLGVRAQAQSSAVAASAGSASGARVESSAPAVVDLATVLRLAAQSSPRLALERQNVVAAQADRVTAAARPNPTLGYAYSRQPGEQTNFGSKNAYNLAIDLPLELGGQRGARIEAAERGIEAARAKVAAATRDLATDAASAYVALLAAQEKHAAMTASGAELDRLREIVAGRLASGMASRFDLLRLDAEQAKVHSQQADAESGIVEKQAELATLLGLPGWWPKGGGAFQPWTGVLPDAGGTSLSEHPTIVAARRDEAAARAAAELARRNRAPAVSVNAGRFWTPSPSGSTYTVGVSVELPFLDSRRGPEDRARAEAQSAVMRREIAEAELQARQRRYEGVVVLRRAALVRYDDEAGRRLPELRDMAESAYRLGRGTVLELLDATRSRSETTLGRIELVAGLMEAQLQLLALRGELTETAAPPQQGIAGPR